MVVITLSDIIGIGIFVLFIITIILYIIVSILINKYRTKSKKWHDCTECVYHKMRTTPNWYECKKGLYDGSHEINDIVWTKCKEFKTKE